MEEDGVRERRKGKPDSGVPIGFYNHYRKLYQRLCLPDNFTDSDFFSTLQMNPKPKNWSILDTALKSSRITFQLCVSVLFFIVYYHLSYGTLDPIPVLYITLLTTVLGYAFYQIYPAWPIHGGFMGVVQVFPKEHIRVSIVYLVFSYQLAPILRTLTDTVSTDTIHATSACMLLVHLLTCDYGVSAFMVSKTISVNAAVIGSICLVSRMSTDFHSLALLTLAAQIFILFPIFSSLIWDSSLTLALLVLTVSLGSFTVSSGTFLIFSIVVFCVNLIFPVIFVISLQFKRNLYGPWDEAVVRTEDFPSNLHQN